MSGWVEFTEANSTGKITLSVDHIVGIRPGTETATYLWLTTPEGVAVSETYEEVCAALEAAVAPVVRQEES